MRLSLGVHILVHLYSDFSQFVLVLILLLLLLLLLVQCVELTCFSASASAWGRSAGTQVTLSDHFR